MKYNLGTRGETAKQTFNLTLSEQYQIFNRFYLGEV